MKYLILLLLSLCSFIELSGQNFLVEYRQQHLFLYKGEAQTATGPALYGDLFNNSFKSHNFDIVLAYQAPKFLYSLRLGLDNYVSIQLNSPSKLNDLSNVDTRTFEDIHHRFKMGLGIEKRINFNRINLFLGLELPLL